MSSEKILQLRALLQERFPAENPVREDHLATGIPRFDDLLEGGLWKGAITELTCPEGSTGSALIFTRLLHTIAAKGQVAALIDGRDMFDPQPVENAVIKHLLWVRCEDAVQAVRAADLLLRDGNLPLVILDLRWNPEKELRRIPGSTWYRLQRVLEQHATACLAITSHPLIPSAQVKLTLESRFNIHALSDTQNALLEKLQIQIARARFQNTQNFYSAEAGPGESLRVAEG